MKKLFALMLALCLAFTMVACGSGSSSEDEVVIGLMGPLTGSLAQYGVAVINGGELAFKEMETINDKAIKTIKLDEKGDVTEAINAYNKLKDEKIDFLLGDVTSGNTIAVAELAAEDNMPMITASGTQDVITTIGGNVFRACFSDSFQGVGIANFVNSELGLKKIAIMYNTSSDYSQGIAAVAKETAEAAGVEVVAYEGYGDADADFNTQLTKIQSSGAEALVLPEYYEKAALVIDQARSKGLDFPVIGPDGFDGLTNVIAADNMAIANNVYFTNHYFSGDDSEQVQNFIAKYKEAYEGEEPNAFAALGYDAAYIIKAAIEKAGSTDKEAVIAAMYETTYSGVTGEISFDENGDPVKSVSIIEIVDGEYSLNAKI